MTRRGSIVGSVNSNTLLLKNRSSSMSEGSSSYKTATPPNVTPGKYCTDVLFGETSCSVTNLRIQYREKETGEVTGIRSQCLLGTKLDTGVLIQGPPDYVKVAVLLCVCFPLSGLPFLWLSYKSRHASQTGDFTVAWQYSNRALYVFTSGMVSLVILLMILVTMIWISRHGMPEDKIMVTWTSDDTSDMMDSGRRQFRELRSDMYQGLKFNVSNIKEYMKLWDSEGLRNTG